MPIPKFLIADDSDAKQMLLEGMLLHHRWKADVLKATTTEQAKKMINEHPDIAFAFVDYEIPTENGPAVIAYLKEKNPGARIAMVSASDLARFESEGRAAGAETFLCTTWEEERFLGEMKVLLEKWKKASS